MFTRIALVDRGAAAMRMIGAVAEFNAAHETAVRTIALHTAAEAGACFVRQADEAVRIGPPGHDGANDAGNPYLDPYLDDGELRRALSEAGADALWPGWGLLAERPGLVELCTELGIVFIGPGAEVMRTLGDGIGARRLAERSGVPVAAWSGGPVETLEGARHIEVQIAADGAGDVWALGVRDASLQQDRQAIIEESASTALSAEREQELRGAAVAVARAAGYRNLGTVEFRYEPGEDLITFLEFSPSLRGGHPVTELCTGVDLVKLALRLAAGERLDGDPPAAAGHAIAARLAARDPAGEVPVGTVELLGLPSGPGVCVDVGLDEGDLVPAADDPMIATVAAWGRDRGEARARLVRALSETTVVLRGGASTKGILLELLTRPDVRSGRLHPGLLDDIDGELATRGAGVGLLVAAVTSYEAAAVRQRARLYESATRGRPHAPDERGHVAELRHTGQAYRLEVTQPAPGRYAVVVDETRIELALERPRRFEARVRVGTRSFRVLCIPDPADYLVEVDGIAHRFSSGQGALVRAPGPAMVMGINVAVGEVVAAGDSLAAVESMKMELPITAPIAGRVAAVFVTRNTQVAAGTALLRLESDSGHTTAGPPAPRLEFGELAAPAASSHAHGRTLECLALLRSLMLGYEVAEARGLADRYTELRRGHAEDEPALLRAELDTLLSFADVCELSRNRRAAEPGEDGEETRSPREYLHAFLRSLDVEAEGLPGEFQHKLRRALAHYHLTDLHRTPALEEACYRIFLAQQRTDEQIPAVLAILDRHLDAETLPETLAAEFRAALDRVIQATQLRFPTVGEAARSARYRCFDAPVLERNRRAVFADMRSELGYLAAHPQALGYTRRIERLVACPQPLIRLLADRAGERDIEPHEPMLEVLTRRFYRAWPLRRLRSFSFEGLQFIAAEHLYQGRTTHVLTTLTSAGRLRTAAAVLALVVGKITHPDPVLIDLYAWSETPEPEPETLSARLAEALDAAGLPPTATRVTAAVTGPVPAERGDREAPVHQHTFHRGEQGFVEDTILRGLHPMIAERLTLWRLSNFDIHRLPATGNTYLFSCTARDNPDDQRLIAIAEVRDLAPVRGTAGRVTALPEIEQMLQACLESLRRARTGWPTEARPAWNRVLLHLWPELDVPLDELRQVARRLAPLTEGLGLEEVAAQADIRAADGTPHQQVLHVASLPGTGLTVRVTDPPRKPLAPMDAYTQKVLKSRRRGTVYPYELIGTLARITAAGDTGEATFTEYDLDADGRLLPTERAYGANSAGIVAGVLRRPTRRYPEGIVRVMLFGDPTKSLGAIAEPECRRVIAALDLAAELGAPLDWFALSAGARIAMDSGTENMDWVARVLRRIVGFTQAGGEINVVVAGINVGAQPYWNAEATMLMHTRGILVMTPDSAMVLTGKQSLDYSGGVSAEDNVGIGGYDRVMGPNGQAQYQVPDLTAACELLEIHHQHDYVAPGERFARRAASTDPTDRDVRESPHRIDDNDGLTRIGDIFSEQANQARKQPFDMRALMRSIADADHPSPERWQAMADAETTIVLEAYLGGQPVTMLGIESRPLPRHGFLPADGPGQWTAGTLFPLSSKKAARALNAASGRRPVAVVANLSGFDGSPESLRRCQLEYGAEIGRAIVNFDGPIVFCVVSRYHGGAFVVFSAALNENLEIAAVEGSFASVIGGAPAAAVVFAGEVNSRTRQDRRVERVQQRLEQAGDDAERAALRAELADTHAAIHAEKLGEIAAEFDTAHTIERAQRVGSVHQLLPPAQLRPFLLDAIQRGIEDTLERRAPSQAALADQRRVAARE